jgi:hypothetical protein
MLLARAKLLLSVRSRTRKRTLPRSVGGCALPIHAPADKREASHSRGALNIYGYRTSRAQPS